MKPYTFLLLLFSTLTTLAQTTITVTVKDAQNNTGLPFATVTSGGKSFIADVDGKVVLEQPATIVYASYTGYAPGQASQIGRAHV